MTKALVSLGGASNVEGVYGVFPTVSWTENAAAIAKMKEYANQVHPDDVNSGDYMAAWAQSLVIAEILKNALDKVGYDTLAKGDAKAWAAVEQYGFQTLKGYDVGGLQSPVSYVTGDNRLGKSLRIFQVQSGVIAPITGWVEAPVIKYEDFDWFTQIVIERDSAWWKDAVSPLSRRERFFTRSDPALSHARETVMS